jgi:hypothetical protein
MDGPRLRWALPLVPVGVSVFFLSALAWFHLQPSTQDTRGIVQGLVAEVHGAIGFVPAFMFFLLVLAWGSIWFLTGRLEALGERLLKVFVLTVSLSVLVNLDAVGGAPELQSGTLGAFLAGRFVNVFGVTISTLLASGLSLIALLLATDFFFYRYFESLNGTPAEESEAGVEQQAVAVLKSFETSSRAVPRHSGVLPRISPMGPAPRLATIPPSPVPESPTVGEADLPVATFDDELARAKGPYTFDRPEAAGAVESVAEAVGEEPVSAEVSEEAESLEPAAKMARAGEQVPERAAADVADPEQLAAEHEEAADEQEETAGEQESEETDDEGDAGEATANKQDWEEPAEEDLDETGTDEQHAEEAAEQVDREAADALVISDDDLAEAVSEAVEAMREGGAPATEDEDVPEAPESGVEIPRPATPPPTRQRTLFTGVTSDPALLDEAARLVIAQHRANAALLQRRLRVSFEDAAELIEQLRVLGVVDGEVGTPSGRVVVELADWEARSAQRG